MSNLSLSIIEASEYFSVSTATIRNWVKTGYLESHQKGYISFSSVLNFEKNHLGAEKLTKRANKLRKDTHNHSELLSIIKNTKNKNAKELSEIYEKELSESYKNKEGIYYTPINIVNKLFKIYSDVSNKTFCDPCCGSGNFIARAIELGFQPENIFGFDTDPIAVEITKRRIFEETGYISNNILCVDFLKEYNPLKFDYIYTNPPWGKKIGKSEKEKIASNLSIDCNNDTSSLFFFACLKNLNEGGILGLLLPEAFFNISSYENSRKELLKYEIKQLSDFGKVFQGVQSGAVSLILKKDREKDNDNILCEKGNILFYRTKHSFLSNPKNIINLYCNQEEAEIIRHLFSLPHITLKGRAKWGLGIVTGNNKQYVKDTFKEGMIPVIRGSDISKTGIQDLKNFIKPDFSLYQQVAPIELFEADEKLIYKFISSELFFYHDTNKHYLLNSANMLIPNSDFPIPNKVLTALLNSEIMSWIFKKIFNTHKVLKGDLEELPIHIKFINKIEFNEDNYITKLNLERGTHGTFRIKE